MKAWLAKLRAPRWYRYIFYRLNKISALLGNLEPEDATILLLSLTNFFQFMFVFNGLGLLIDFDLWDYFIQDINPLFTLVPIGLVLERANHYLFRYQKKWVAIMEEFAHEKKRQKHLGKYYVFFYFLVTIALFCVGMWFLTFNNPNYA